jgi:hypothetical protein
VLTPVEDLGLSGARMARRVHRVLRGLPQPELAALLDRLHERALARRLVYWHDDQVEAIRVLARPLAVLPQQLSYVRYVSFTLQNALKRLPDLYLTDAAVRAALRLPDDEERWLKECWGQSQREVNPVFGRLDAVIDFASPMWKDTLRFLEPNLSGIGGLHMGPACDRIVADEVLPLLARADPGLHLVSNVDLRELLMQEIVDHLEAIGRRGQHVCFVEPKYATDGPDEQEELGRYLRGRYGLRMLHADPGELALRGDEVVHEGVVVDVAYRDYSVADLVELEAEGVDVEPMRRLLRENRMITSIAGDLDCKSCFEVFTDLELAARHFRAEEQQMFRRHVPWTRIMADRRTSLPGGGEGDLYEFARREREHLVLKPNRGYGGEGVLVGPTVHEADWEAALSQAMVDPDQRWVVQALAVVPIVDFPVVDGDSVGEEPFFVVMGFVPSKYGLGVLARASQAHVVNVAQRGGMCAVVIGSLAPGLDDAE